MDISNRSSYNTNIYLAIVVNVDTTQDPAGRERIQIYIPSIQYEYQGVYQEYINSSDKTSSE